MRVNVRRNEYNSMFYSAKYNGSIVNRELVTLTPTGNTALLSFDW